MSDLLAKLGARVSEFLRTRLREGSPLLPTGVSPQAVKQQNMIDEVSRLKNPTKSEKLTKVISTAD